jgi:hypothetical protein
MFILQRQDVEIASMQHPTQDQKVPVLRYSGQTFRLLKTFDSTLADEALALWRDLVDQRGKVCILLQEPQRHSVWGLFRPEEAAIESKSSRSAFPVEAGLQVILSTHLDVEEFLGSRQAKSFVQDMSKVLQQKQVPKMDDPCAMQSLLSRDPGLMRSVSAWRDRHWDVVLGELHVVAKKYLGNTGFVARAMEAVLELPESERAPFLSWVNQSPVKQLWAPA